MDLTQTKLTKTEWNNTEIPVSEDEKKVLQLIKEGYNNVDIRSNVNQSLFQLIKLETTSENENYLYKKYFEMVEDLHKEHLLLLEKVKDKTSEDFVKNIDYFDTDKYNYIRKKILDAGNDTIRTIDANLKSVNVTLK